MLLLKSARPSHVHRAGAMDVIVVKTYDEGGRVSGERRFCGLFTSSAYHASPREIPLLRRKVARMLARAGFDPASHDGKTLLNILETHPRDEMFQSDDDTLYSIATGVLQLQERQHVALFTRRDAAARFLSCLVYAPRDRYDSDLRRRFMATLEHAYDGVVASYSVAMGDESVLARVLFIVRPHHPEAPQPDDADVERQLADVARTWADRLRDSLTERYGEIEARKLTRRFGTAFPAGYREAFDGATAARDLVHISAALSEKPLGIELIAAPTSRRSALGLKLFNTGAPIALSDVLPILENMDLRVMTETPYRVVVPGEDGGEVWLHDFGLKSTRAAGRPAEAGDDFGTALGEIWTGAMENDGMNRLVLRAGLDARDVGLRAMPASCARPASPSARPIWRALAAIPTSRPTWWEFHARLDPDLGEADAPRRIGAVDAVRDSSHAALEQVTSLDEDRILRRLLSAVNATLRTNFWRAADDGGPKSFLSLKIDSRALDELPAPRPLVEIFVYSPRVEGVHLRGGRVARGGIRWSDRREEFRTEILGLMKAADGEERRHRAGGLQGWLLLQKRMPAGGTREQIQAEASSATRADPWHARRHRQSRRRRRGRAATRGGAPRRRRSYLVVAADRARRPSPTSPTTCRRNTTSGWATPSPRADRPATTTRKWASPRAVPGRTSGVTSASWASTSRRPDFTTVGVGDMSGDVFGNGMLRSRHTRLLAAFDHRHIFVDPARSTDELRRAPAPVRPAALVLGRLRQGAAVARRLHRRA